MVRKRFIRKETKRYVKLGKNNKRSQKWRKAKGRDNKMREKIHGHAKKVEVGYKKEIKEIKEIRVSCLRDLEKVSKKDKIILSGRLGRKKKTEIVKKAKEMKIQFKNINVNKFLKEDKK